MTRRGTGQNVVIIVVSGMAGVSGGACAALAVTFGIVDIIRSVSLFVQEDIAEVREVNLPVVVDRDPYKIEVYRRDYAETVLPCIPYTEMRLFAS